MAFEQYVHSVAEGRPMDDALLVQACHMRAIDLGRRLAGAQGARPRGDVYDERKYNAGHVELLRLDGLDSTTAAQEQALFGWAEPDAINPARMLASAIDLERWLARLASRGPADARAAAGRSHARRHRRCHGPFDVGHLREAARARRGAGGGGRRRGRDGEGGVSRVIDRAQLAVTSDGEVLLNVARFDVPKRIEEIVTAALRQRGAVFIGVGSRRGR